MSNSSTSKTKPKHRRGKIISISPKKPGGKHRLDVEDNGPAPAA